MRVQPVGVRENLTHATHGWRALRRVLRGVLGTVAGAAAVLLLLSGAAPWAASAAAPAPSLELGVLTPPDHSMTTTAERIASRAAALTQANGAPPPAIRVRHSARRGNETAMLAQVRDGDLALSLLTLTEPAVHDPRLRVFFAPHLAADIPAGAALLATPTARRLFAEAGDTLGVEVLGVGLLGLRHLAMVAPPPTTSTGAPFLKGLRMRVPPVQCFELFYDLLGTETVPLPLPAVRAAVEAGAVDGIDMDIEMLLAADYVSATPHVVLSGHMLFPVIAVVSPQVWEGLPPDLRSRLVAVVNEELAVLTDEQAVRETTAPEVLRDAGFIPHPAPPPEVLAAPRARWWASQADLRPLADSLTREGARHVAP